MNPILNDTRPAGSPIPLVANSDLTGYEGRVVAIVDKDGAAAADLPSANSDFPLCVLCNGDEEGAQVDVLRMIDFSSMRVALKGTCSVGSKLVLADVATAADKGKARALPATAGTYKVFGIAAEAGVDGQNVAFFPISVISETVSAG